MATEPRTISVRVRTLVILGAIVVAAGAVWWTLSWASGMQPLSSGFSIAGPTGLPVAAHMPDDLGSGPTAYRWRRGGTYVVQLGFHNSASVPITITGADHTDADWDGPLAGPTLRNATVRYGLLPGAFRVVRIPADGTRVVAFVFHANPHASCSTDVMTMDTVNVHFSTLGVFHDTQTVPLGDMAAVMTGRRTGC